MTKSIAVEVLGSPPRAGVSVPDSPLITEAIEYAQKICEPYLFNHALRSWLFAANLGQLKGINCDLEVVAVGTILHDIGLTTRVSGPNRFEVNGADAALSFVKDRGFSDRRAQLVWDLVALNSTPSIALHKEAEVLSGHDGHRARLRRIWLRADPGRGDDRNSRGIPASQDERQIRRDVLPSRGREA